MIPQIGKTLIFCGFLLILIGFIFLFHFKIPYFGKLPGDIYIKKENFTLFIPFGTCILISIIFTIIFYLISRFFK